MELIVVASGFDHHCNLKKQRPLLEKSVGTIIGRIHWIGYFIQSTLFFLVADIKLANQFCSICGF